MKNILIQLVLFLHLQFGNCSLWWQRAPGSHSNTLLSSVSKSSNSTSQESFEFWLVPYVRRKNLQKWIDMYSLSLKMAAKDFLSEMSVGPKAWAQHSAGYTWDLTGKSACSQRWWVTVFFSLMCNNLPVLPLNIGSLLSEPQDPWHSCLRWRVALKSSGVREEGFKPCTPPHTLRALHSGLSPSGWIEQLRLRAAHLRAEDTAQQENYLPYKHEDLS